MNTPSCRILIVDDEPIKRSVLEDGLRDAGYVVSATESPLEAEPLIEETYFDVVITDLRMPGQDGLSFLGDLKRRRPEQAVIVMTAYGTVETAVEAMKLGAFDYIQKPFSTEELLLKLDRLLRYEGLSRENEELRRALSPRPEETRIVGSSDAITRILESIHAISGTDSNVLIEGESGTGKELSAKVIHETSHRASGPFVAASCAALPRELVESELFGHEPGAFTGAMKRRLGRFELARGGTLFLDDVDDIPLDVQVKLLRVLQDRTFERVGGEQPIRVNVRVIAATKRSLAAMVAAGEFREDLYYRLSVVPLHLPPLRERLEDVPLLVEHFLEKIAFLLNRGEPSISPAAVAKLQAYHWPGNIRELAHLLERAVTFARGDRLEESDIPELASGADSTALVSVALDKVDAVDMAEVLGNVESRMVRWALDRSSGNLARAAEMLGLPRSTLQYKAAKFAQAGQPATSSAGARPNAGPGKTRS
ncbi:MAG: sigma-54-dependent transcriptional regulator [Planctomycetota bacterium]|jgi:DNA-binding NtrC family response regulator